MQNLASVVLDYIWLLEFSEEDEVDPDSAVKLLEDMTYQIENVFSQDEKQALCHAAERRLQWWLQEPDEHGYTPRKLLTLDQKALLEAIAAGRFDGFDIEDVTDEQ